MFINYVAKMKIHIHRTTPTIQSPLSSAKIKWFQIDEHYTITFNSTKMCNTSTCSKMLYGTYKWAWECSIIFWNRSIDCSSSNWHSELDI
ncbi:hypothetical protein Prudu_019915 [Prunus dulcis]|uniref:Uncharacterized protein n=1 Tax=Prunus dulcis TaxID=3755 RepID=A0A4Y1RVT8_PRUDU|nr:hypothetical protein Prudu_019915 [Prunus dulcis]